MKKLRLLILLVVLSIQGFSQTAPCPNLSTINSTVNCITPCTTLTATPSITLNATTTYAVSSIVYAPNSYTIGAGVSTITDDIFSSTITIPFCFNFFGINYTQLIIGSNGNVVFGSTLAGAYDPWSVTGPLPGSNCNATYNAIMSPWCDIYPPGGGSIKYNTYGVAPCRKFVISYNNLTMFLPGTYCTGIIETSQIVLYETSNIIDIYIGNHVGCTSWSSGYAITGIENTTGTLFYTAPGQNGTVFTASNQGWRFTPSGTPYNWNYTWTGPSGVIGTTPSIVLCPTTTTTYTITANTTTSCSSVSISSLSTITSISSIAVISGLSNLCQGSTSTLSSSSIGGTWSSSNSAIASIDSNTGVLSGLAPGTTTITYSNGSCTATKIVTINPIYNTAFSASICAGSSYTYAGGIYSITGTYPHTYLTTKGCDSIVTMNLIVNPVYLSTVTATICNGQSYIFLGNTYSITGTYPHTFLTTKGCDSIVTLSLIIKPTFTSAFSVDICQGQIYSFGSNTYSVTGTYTSGLTIDTIAPVIYDETDRSLTNKDSVRVEGSITEDYLNDVRINGVSIAAVSRYSGIRSSSYRLKSS